MRVFNIDISRKGISPVVQVTEYDAMSRFFTLVLRNGSSDYEPPENPNYSVWYKTKDSTGWYDTITLPDESTRPAVVADGNAFTIEIAEQATTSCGELALMINGDDGYQLTVSGIITRSDDIPGYDGEEVENYYNVFITRMQENAARAENAADIAVAYGATVEVDEDAQQLNITHHSDTEGGVGWLFGSAVTSSAEGSVAAFPDGANDVAVKSLVATINPVQSGSGDPSPTNVRAISGRTGLTVKRCGKNLIPNIKYQSSANAVYLGAATANYELYLPVGTYTLSVEYLNNAQSGAYYRLSSDSANRTIWSPSSTAATGTFTVDKDESLNLWLYKSDGVSSNNIGNFQLEAGGTATDYTPYVGQTYPISWQTQAGAIYGGTLNVTTGVLTVTHAIVDLGTLTWSKTISTSSGNKVSFRTTNEIADMKKSTGNTITQPIICSQYQSNRWDYTVDYATFDNCICEGWKDKSYIAIADSAYNDSDAATFKTAMSGVQLVYELATPSAVVQLSPTEIKTLLGGNTIYTDAGSVSVEYVADTKLYIDNKIAELQALILEN